MKLQLDTNAIYRRKDDLGPYDVAAPFEHKCASLAAACRALQLAQTAASILDRICCWPTMKDQKLAVHLDCRR